MFHLAKPCCRSNYRKVLVNMAEYVVFMQNKGKILFEYSVLI
jgi:hypothetical protein